MLTACLAGAQEVVTTFFLSFQRDGVQLPIKQVLLNSSYAPMTSPDMPLLQPSAPQRAAPRPPRLTPPAELGSGADAGRMALHNGTSELSIDYRCVHPRGGCVARGGRSS